MSSTRIFSTADFVYMAKLVSWNEGAKQDPRLASKRRRTDERGEAFDLLSDEDNDDERESNDEEDGVRVQGAATPDDIIGVRARSRKSREEKLARIVAGRNKFEAKGRPGGVDEQGEEA